MTIWYYTCDLQGECFCPSDDDPCAPFFSNRKALYLHIFNEELLENEIRNFDSKEVRQICRIIDEIENESYNSADEFLEELDEIFIQHSEVWDEYDAE